MSEKAIEVEEVDDEKLKELYREIAVVERPTSPQCYCNQIRDFKYPDFLCSNCSKWFHKSCIKFTIGRVIPFMTAYYFMCKNCNENNEEVFSRKQCNFSGMCQTAIANLMCTHNNRAYFSKINDIIPFLEQCWESLTTQPKKQYAALNSSIHKTLLNAELFKFYGYGEDLIVSLKNPNLHLLKPGYDQFKILASQLKTKVTSSGGVQPQSGGWHANIRKRKTASNTNNANTGLVSSNAFTSNRLADSGNGKPVTRRNEEAKVKLTQFNFPVDHPFNKDNYRYIYVEPDPNAPGKQTWEECETTAGRIIPGFFYRTYIDSHIVLSTNDRAHQLKLHDNQMLVTGYKGYCMNRATHFVSRGSWYYEAEITDQPEGSHARIGWSQLTGNLQAPCGFDKFGYSIRSKFGTAFHNSKGHSYIPKKEGFGKGDVIGCLFQVDDPILFEEKLKHRSAVLPNCYKKTPLVRFKCSYYYEDREDPNKEEQNIVPLKNSRLIFYKNGKCLGTAFSDIYDGRYYPSISLYKACQVKVNFGPKFAFPPSNYNNWKPMTERYSELVVEQLMSDMIWLATNKEYIDGVLRPGK